MEMTDGMVEEETQGENPEQIEVQAEEGEGTYGYDIAHDCF